MACSSVSNIENSSVRQFIEQIVVEPNAFASTSALDVFDEIGRQIVRTADRVVPNSADNSFELLLLPGTVARIGTASISLTKYLKLLIFAGVLCATASMQR